MELWELLQLSRPEINRMRQQVADASQELDEARKKLVKSASDKVTFCYPDAELLLYVNKFLRDYHGDKLHPQNLPDNIVFFLWLCFGSFVEGDSRFNYSQHREERMEVVADMIICAPFLKKALSLERVCEYYDLLVIEVDERGFYLPWK